MTTDGNDLPTDAGGTGTTSNKRLGNTAFNRFPVRTVTEEDSAQPELLSDSTEGCFHAENGHIIRSNVRL